MSEPGVVLTTFLAGVILGGIFFGGLWWTVQKAVTSAQPAAWFATSMMFRTVLAVGGFWVTAAGQWQRLICALVGFVVARMMVTWVTRPIREREVGSHES